MRDHRPSPFASFGSAARPLAGKKAVDTPPNPDDTEDADGDDTDEDQDDADDPDDDDDTRARKKVRRAKKAKKAKEEEKQDEKDEADPAARAVRKRERARCAAILSSPHAGGPNIVVACHLAFGTSMPRSAVVRTLAELKNVEGDKVAAVTGASMAERIVAAGRKRRGEDAPSNSAAASQPAMPAASQPTVPTDPTAAAIVAAGNKRRGEGGTPTPVAMPAQNAHRASAAEIIAAGKKRRGEA